MKKKFAEYKNFDLAGINREVLKKWKEEDTFHKSLAIRENAPAFVFYEGPPSANGKPGIHHVISRTIKDIVCRYKTLEGFRVDRKAGWDTHGLPVELAVEKMLDITKEAKILLIDKGYDEKYGARPLRRAVERYLEDPLAEAILRGDVKTGELIVVARDGDHLTFEQESPISEISS